MRRLWAKIIGLTAMATLLLTNLALAAGPEAAPLVMVADTRNFTGWEAWWINLYNESHILFRLAHRGDHPDSGSLFRSWPISS